jgi:DNA primase
VDATSADDELHRLRDLTAAAAAVFTEPARRRAAVSYLRQRGIDASGLSPQWSLGYAPPGWTRLVDRLGPSFPAEALLAAGLARRCSRGTLIDTFRHRVMFGIRDVDGSIAGFIGRDLSGDPRAPKYLNTQQHALFDKGTLLFGLHEGVRTPGGGQPVVVEGPLDVLAIAARHQAVGCTALLPIAPSGTAFTTTQANRVAEVAVRHDSAVVVALDSDAPGRAAALEAGERLRQAGATVRVAMLPNGTDPAEYLARPGSDLDAFHAGNGLSLINLHVERAMAEQDDRMQWLEGRIGALHRLTPYLASYPPRHAARQVGWVARALDLSPSTVTRELAEAFQRQPSVGRQPMSSIGL